MPKKNKIPERKKRKEVGIQFKENEDEEYGKVEKCLGDCRFLISSKDAKYTCHLRKAAQKAGRVMVGDTVLFQRRLDSSKTGDIIHKYSPQDANKLASLGEIANHEVEFRDDFAEELKAKSTDDVDVNVDDL